MRNEKDLYKLTSIDATGAHIDIIPADVKGFFRTRRTILQYILIVIFLGLPWITHNGVQLVQLDIARREFTLFSWVLKAHDAPLIFFIIMTFVLALAFVTAVWGRIWCGWACPQTVFIDAIYRRIETWTEGHYLDRRRFQKESLTFKQTMRKLLKWILFLVVSSIFSHSFVAYFTGSRELVAMMHGSPSEHLSYFVIIMSMTVLVTFNFGWFREQFCVIMCPYGRIQSVLLEPSSLAVVYDNKRGEPRRDRRVVGGPTGDCISCNRCVEVCPTGIDIRNGLQMECIACTACIDACDDIMGRVNKPKGLIKYQTLDQTPLKVWKTKSSAYGTAIALVLGLLIFNLATRQPLNIAVLRGIDAPFTEGLDAEGQAQIINHFRLHLISQSHQDTQYEVKLSPDAISKGMSLVMVPNPLTLKSEASETFHVFVKAPKNLFAHQAKMDTEITIQSADGYLTTRTFNLLGPNQ